MRNSEGILGAVPIAVNAVGMLVIYGIIVVAVWKIFAISSELAQVKEMVREIQRNTDERAITSLASNPQSPESLARALNAAAYREVDPAILLDHESK